MKSEDRKHAPYAPSLVPTSNPELRSAYGSLPGEEFPKAVYGSAVAAFVSVVVISWLAFGGSDDADLVLGFATVLTVVSFALPILVRRTAASRSREKPTRGDDFLHSRVEIATGTLTGAQAWLQILVIPLALAFAAVAIGTTYLIVA